MTGIVGAKAGWAADPRLAASWSRWWEDVALENWRTAGRVTAESMPGRLGGERAAKVDLPKYDDQQSVAGRSLGAERIVGRSVGPASKVSAEQQWGPATKPSTLLVQMV